MDSARDQTQDRSWLVAVERGILAIMAVSDGSSLAVLAEPDSDPTSSPMR